MVVVMSSGATEADMKRVVEVARAEHVCVRGAAALRPELLRARP